MDNQAFQGNNSVIDYIIIGQGLAGTVMGLTLEMAGLSVAVVDPCLASTSSRTAAGIFNPVTGPRYSKTWQAEAVWASLWQFYPRAEKFLGTRFFHPGPLFRPFNNLEEQNFLMGKSADKAYASFIDTDCPATLAPLVHAPHGGFMVRRAGRVDVPALLDAYREHKRSQNLFFEGTVQPRDVVPLPEGGVKWGEITARHAIWCLGWQQVQHPEFESIKLAPVKGEVLTVALQQPLDAIVSGKAYVVPAGQLYLVGATYDNKNLNDEPTAAGRAELEQAVAQVLLQPFTVVDHKAGVRPATPQRRPVAGRVPGLPHMSLLNGLGTKGVSLAPFVAMQLMLHLEINQPLLPELSVRKNYIYSQGRDSFAMQFGENS